MTGEYTKISIKSLSQKFLRMLPWLILAGLLFFQASFFVNSRDLNDFGSFVASGRAVRKGLNPYGVYPLTSSAVYQDREADFPNMNPPLSLFAFELLANLDPYSALQIWKIFSFVLYALVLVPLYRIYQTPLIWLVWAFTLAGFWDTLVLGQIYIPILAAVAGTWLFLRGRKEILAGILMGIAAAVKPNLLFWPLLLFAAGYRRSALWAVGTAFALSLLPLFRYGHQVYLDWIQAAASASWTDLPHYMSLFSLAERMGLPWSGFPLALLLTAALAWWAWKKRPSILLVSGAALAGAILVSPLATPRFTLLLIPLFYSLFEERALRIPASIFLVPTSILVWLGLQSDFLLVVLGFLYPAALLSIIITVTQDQSS